MSCLTATQSISFAKAANAEYHPHSGARRNQGANRRPGTSRTHISLSCRINRVAAERDIRPKVGRYRLRARHDERHPFHRVRSGRPVQDRIIAKASANASDSRGRSDAVEKTLYLHPAGGLGFCNQALSGPKTVLGPGDLAQIHTSCSNESEFRSDSDGIRSVTPTRPCCEAWGLSSRRCMSCCGIRRSAQRWTFTRRQ
jgi:hypothetical protein